MSEDESKQQDEAIQDRHEDDRPVVLGFGERSMDSTIAASIANTLDAQDQDSSIHTTGGPSVEASPSDVERDRSLWESALEVDHIDDSTVPQDDELSEKAAKKAAKKALKKDKKKSKKPDDAKKDKKKSKKSDKAKGKPKKDKKDKKKSKK